MGLFSRPSREERFWRWFQGNSDRLFTFDADRERVFDDLSAELNRVEKGLTFEFGPVQDAKREFIVSADGIKDRFPAVRRLVQAAPEMAQWIVIPFRPPKSLAFVVQYGDSRLGPDDIWFLAEADRGLAGLTLFIRGLTPENDHALGGAAFILLDNALGEFAVETQVGYIERKALPADPAAMGLRPFRSIREALDLVTH